MPTTPFASAQISVNSGAPQQGGITVAGASTIQLSGTNTSNWTQARWEIYAYPSGWATPTGWTLDSATGIIYSTSTTPTLITLEAAATRWGKWLVRLIVNGGTKNGVSPVFDVTTGSYLPNDVIDIATGWQVLSPQFAFLDPGLFEGTQFGGLRRWADALQKNLRLLDAFVFSGGTGTATWRDGTDAAYVLPAATGLQNVTIPALTASRTWKLSNATAADGMRVTLDDSGYSGSATSGRYTQAAASSFLITVQGFNGTEHIYAEGKDQGTTYVMPVALLGNGRLAFEYRLSDSTWHLA